ncbi:hypothetical protein ACF1G5_31695 [Streptomyces coeruleorubidus]|uniref:hypothetical protein n=1 Tax=Streptomyces coeruleorubidus TaxID=116188 RepID=UPI0036FFD2F8
MSRNRNGRRTARDGGTVRAARRRAFAVGCVAVGCVAVGCVAVLGIAAEEMHTFLQDFS